MVGVDSRGVDLHSFGFSRVKIIDKVLRKSSINQPGHPTIAEQSESAEDTLSKIYNLIKWI